MLTGTEGQLSVKVFGQNLETLNGLVEDVRHVMSGIRGVADLQVEQTAGIPQLVISLDRRATNHIPGKPDET
jgi:cobalt-zinc-cadmium resistance protein CzcA